MADSTPQTGAEAAAGTTDTDPHVENQPSTRAQRNRRRLLKGAAAVAPMIITMRSSAGWAASTQSCGQVLHDMDLDLNNNRPERLRLWRNNEQHNYDAIVDTDRIGLDAHPNRNNVFFISQACFHSFMGVSSRS